MTTHSSNLSARFWPALIPERATRTLTFEKPSGRLVSVNIPTAAGGKNPGSVRFLPVAANALLPPHAGILKCVYVAVTTDLWGNRSVVLQIPGEAASIVVVVALTRLPRFPRLALLVLSPPVTCPLTAHTDAVRLTLEVLDLAVAL